MTIHAKDLYDAVLDMVRNAVVDEAECKPITMLILHYRFGCDNVAILTNAEVNTRNISCDIDSILARLSNDEPIQYILGISSFLGLDMHVNKSVLIPRQETEEMVLDVLSHNLSGKRVVDICTGSGCIAICVKNKYPTSIVYGVDISESALDVARRNAKMNNVDITWFCHDVLSNDAMDDMYVDVVVSNPPYVCNSEMDGMCARVLNYEPHVALFVEDKLPLKFYEKIIDICDKCLNDNGCVFFEINERFGNEVQLLLLSRGYANVVINKDMNGKDRWVYAKKL